jgi:hypothetical protein
MKGAARSSETSVLTRSKRRRIQEDDIPQRLAYLENSLLLLIIIIIVEILLLVVVVIEIVVVVEIVVKSSKAIPVTGHGGL